MEIIVAKGLFLLAAIGAIIVIARLIGSTKELKKKGID
jgi:hypothetical protein